MSPTTGRRRGWRLAMATCGCSGGGRGPVTGRLSRPFPQAPTADANRPACATGSTTPRGSSSTASNRDDSGPTWSSSSRSRTPNPGADATRPQFGGPATRPRPTTLANVMEQRHDVTLQEYKFHYTSFVGPSVARGVADGVVWARHGLQPAAVAVRRARSSNRGGHCLCPRRPPQLGQRLLSLQLRRVHAGQHRLEQRAPALSPRRWRTPRRRASVAVIFNEGTQHGPASSSGPLG